MKAWRFSGKPPAVPVKPRFNSATPVKAWRSVTLVAKNLAAYGLQFGHAREGVEIFGVVAAGVGEDEASIRPRP